MTRPLNAGNPPQMAVCAECGVRAGTGHVMRSLALAQAWKRADSDVVFFIPEGLAGIEDRLREEGMAVGHPPDRLASPAALVAAALRIRPDFVVLDGYGFGAAEQAAVGIAGVPALALDDYSQAERYSVRWVLNQNAYARANMYPETKAALLLGTRYALLRDEFSPWIPWRREIPRRARNILVTMGGSDPEGMGQLILDSLRLIGARDLEVVLIAGPANPNSSALRAAADLCPVPVRVLSSVRDMPAQMAWADVAIAAAGVTAYELCFMGLPSLLLIAAENQRRIAECLSDLSASVNAGTAHGFHPEVFAMRLVALIDSEAERATLSSKGRELVDGLGSERVRAALVGREINLRPLRESDCDTLFSWAIDPASRAASFHPAPISRERHANWFSRQLGVCDSIVAYIADDSSGRSLGLVRFQIEGDRATLSVNIAPAFRGKGWGRALVTLAIRSLARLGEVRQVQAFVKPQNSSSLRLFEACGFRRAGEQKVADQDAELFLWDCTVPELPTPTAIAVPSVKANSR